MVAASLPFGRYRFLHALPQNLPPFRMQSANTLGGFQFRCDLRDCISREICFAGVYEPQETFILKHILQQGMTFVDVGANWGYHTLLAAHQVGPQGRVLSLEPDPRLFAMLREHVAANAMTQVVVLPYAASDHTRTVALAGFQAQGGNYGVSRLARADESPAVAFDVSCRRLDDLIHEQNLGTVHLLKMDIEGGEAAALRGLERHLEGLDIWYLLLELHPERLRKLGESIDSIILGICSFGYRCYRIDHSTAVTRRVAYGRSTAIGNIVQPHREGYPLDAWPHLLFAAGKHALS